uniref:Uncharacterized protein n=1 Tax=Panagrolaimus sp. JU765 TaxID=591449 RepID=A0AC34PZD8_9BILA
MNSEDICPEFGFFRNRCFVYYFSENGLQKNIEDDNGNWGIPFKISFDKEIYIGHAALEHQEFLFSSYETLVVPETNEDGFILVKTVDGLRKTTPATILAVFIKSVLKLLEQKLETSVKTIYVDAALDDYNYDSLVFKNRDRFMEIFAQACKILKISRIERFPCLPLTSVYIPPRRTPTVDSFYPHQPTHGAAVLNMPNGTVVDETNNDKMNYSQMQQIGYPPDYQDKYAGYVCTVPVRAQITQHGQTKILPQYLYAYMRYGDYQLPRFPPIKTWAQMITQQPIQTIPSRPLPPRPFPKPPPPREKKILQIIDSTTNESIFNKTSTISSKVNPFMKKINEAFSAFPQPVVEKFNEEADDNHEVEDSEIPKEPIRSK